MKGAVAIARALRSERADIAFGLPGAHNLALWPAFAEEGMRIVGMRHEQSCVYAADGFTRAVGKPATVLVTTGPGAANTVAAVGEAWASRSPVVVIATDIPSTLRRPGMYRGVLHECTDQAALFEPVTKARFTVERGDDLATVVREAVRVATTAPQRPVYVGIPTDFLTAETGAGTPPTVPISRNSRVPWFVDAVAPSRRPLLWVGGGARHADGAVDALARRLGAPVVTTYQARGVLAPDHPLLVGAPPHEPEVTALIARADLAIVIGSDLDQMNTMGWRLPLPERRIAINVDRADAVKNYAMDAVLEADAEFARTLARDLPPRESWAGDLGDLATSIRARLSSDPATADAIEFLEHTEASLDVDTVVFADMCIAGYWLAGHLRASRPRGLHYPMGWGTLGFALPAAVGTAATRPESPTLAFVGDGGALFALGELSALAEHRAACTVVVIDDDGYGMLRYGHEGEDVGSDLPSVDFAQVAAGFGVDATSVDGVGADYAKALAAAVATGTPHLLHVRARLTPPATTTPRWPIKEDTP